MDLTQITQPAKPSVQASDPGEAGKATGNGALGVATSAQAAPSPLASTTPATESRFSIAMSARLVANGMLLGGIAYALQPFMGWVAAVPMAAVQTFIFGKLVDMAVSPLRRKTVRVAAVAGAVAVGTMTTSLAYATYYAKTSAPESARRDFLARREVAERQVQRVVTLGTSAQQAMDEWSKDAAAKSTIESTTGNTCPTKGTNGIKGPISTWRKDDSNFAASLAGELKGLVDAARTAAETVANSPLSDDTKALKPAYAAVNTAIDKTAALVKGGWAEGALTALAERRSAQIDHAAGKINCGDSGRLSLIERASVELTKLNDMPAMARLVPSIDLDKPLDVITRGLIRGTTITAHAASFGYVGNFNDDPLLKEQLKSSGWIGRETMPYGLSLLAEGGVMFTSFIAAQQGSLPFGLSLPVWLRRREAAAMASSRRRSALAEVLLAGGRLLGKLLANLLWTDAPAGSARAGSAAALAQAGPHPAGGLTVLAAVRAARYAPADTLPESSAFGPIDLPEDPTLRDRELGFAATLAAWHHAWGMEDYLLLPMTAAHSSEQRMARALATQDLAHFVADGVGWKALTQQRAAVAPMLQARLGQDAEHLLYEVWLVKPAYAHLMRLAALGPAATVAQPQAAIAMSSVAAEATGRQQHVPLRRKRLWQQQGMGPFGQG